MVDLKVLSPYSIRSMKGDNMYTLFVDSDCDFTPNSAAEIGAKLISMPYSIGNDEFFPYETWKEYKPDEFYSLLRKGTLPKTSGLSPEKYISYFEPEFKEGKDILYCHFSKAMTMSFDSMKIALSMLKEKYPERKFYEIDTKAITSLAFTIAREVGKLYKAGKSPEELIEWADMEVDHYAMYFFADDLKFFARSGRVSGISAKMGNLFGVKPIIYMNEEGKMVTKGKALGKAAAIQTILSYMDEFGDEVTQNPIVIGHTGWEEGAKMCRDAIEKKYGKNLDITILVVNPTAGSHCGPNGVGIAFHSKHR